MLIIISFVLLGCMIGMIIDRHFLLKFYLCYETCFFTISVIMLLCSCEINEIILVLYFLWNTTFEVVLGLSVLWVFHELCPFQWSLFWFFLIINFNLLTILFIVFLLIIVHSFCNINPIIIIFIPESVLKIDCLVRFLVLRSFLFFLFIISI